MPITGIQRGERYGYGLAQGETTLVNVKWNAFQSNVLAGLRNKKRFIDSAGFWAHTALIYADPLNASDVLFGPNANAATRVLTPGSEYQIPPVFPMIKDNWCVFDLADWWFCCNADPATIFILYV